MQRRWQVGPWVLAALVGFSAEAGQKPSDLADVPRSRLATRAAAQRNEWLQSLDSDRRSASELLEQYLPLDGSELRERRRRLAFCTRALSGAEGRAAQATAQALRAGEAQLSAHVLVNPFQYVVDFRDPSYRVEVAPYPQLDVREACTVSLWLRLEGSARVFETKVYSHSDVNDNKFNLMLHGRKLDLLIGTQAGGRPRFRLESELPMRRWVHVVASYAASRGAAIFVDGQEQTLTRSDGEDSLGPIRADSEQELYLGCLDRCLPGSLDDVRVFSRSLSEQEVRALALGEDLRRGLVGHWKFEEATGVLAENDVEGGGDGVVGEQVQRGIEGAPALGGRALGFSGKAARWSQRLLHLELRVDSLELALVRLHRPAAKSEFDLAALVAQLRSAQATLLCYLQRSDSEYTALTLQADGRAHRVDVTLPAALLDSIDDQLASATRRSDDHTWRSTARELSRLLWDPIERDLALDTAAEAPEIWLSLPSRLRGIPFAALLDADGHYLQERIAFARVGPLAASRRARSPAQGRVLLVGNPNFGAPEGFEQPQPWKSSEGDGLRAGECFLHGTPLFGTHLEIERLETRLAEANTLQLERLEWGKAFEATIRERAATASVLHLATHGYQLDGECLPQLPAEALERCGLKLGGSDILRPDDRAIEDLGHLSAAALSRLDLKAAQLVFFSGCETAERGQGSLATAAWLAGAHCCIGSLLPIEDSLTPVLVDAFYAQWLSGRSPARALRQAAEALRAAVSDGGRQPHPARWAAFVLEGL